MPSKKKEDFARVAFNRNVDGCEVGLRFLEKKGDTVGHIYIRAYGSLGSTLAEVFTYENV
jgi:hypothetical protein